MNLPAEFEFRNIGLADVVFEAMFQDGSYLIKEKGSNQLPRIYSTSSVITYIQEKNWILINDDVAEDIINKPSHYHKNEIDVVGYLEKHFPLEGEFTVSEGFYIGNTIKYVSRYKEKNGLEDLEKAAFYLGKLIDIEKSKIGEE